jgi:hypothetical protein
VPEHCDRQDSARFKREFARPIRAPVVDQDQTHAEALAMALGRATSEAHSEHRHIHDDA